MPFASIAGSAEVVDSRVDVTQPIVFWGIGLVERGGGCRSRHCCPCVCVFVCAVSTDLLFSPLRRTVKNKRCARESNPGMWALCLFTFARALTALSFHLDTKRLHVRSSAPPAVPAFRRRWGGEML